MKLCIVAVCLLLMVIAISFSREQRNKKYIQTLSPITEHPDLVGDGAWITQPAKYPDRFKSYRYEIEPRGM